MSEKKLKIIAVVLMVAAFICLSIGTAFAVDFMAEHPEEFACDLHRSVVAANRPLVDPVVEPLNDVVSLEDIVSPFAYVSLSEFSDLPSGRYAVDLSDFYASFLNFVSVDEIDPTPRFSILGFVDVQSIDIPFSSFVLYNSTFEGFAVDTESQEIYFSFVGGGDEFVCPYVGDGVVFLQFYDSFAVLDADDQLISSTLAAASLHGLRFRYADVVVNPIVSTLVSGLRSLGQNVGRAFSTMANAIFINADGTGLSTFGILVVVFAAVSLGLSLTRWVLNFCGSWGKRNR